MSDQDDSITRRKFLENASVAVGAATLGIGCSSDAGADGPEAGAGGGGSPATGGTSGSGAGGASGTAADGVSSSRAGRSGAGAGSSAGRSAAPAGSTGSAAGTPGSAGTSGAAAGTSGSAAGETASAGAGASTAASGQVVVAIVARSDIDEAVARAVELAGGLGAIQPGQTVFIKPNAVSDRMVGTPGIRTSPEVLAAVVRLVRARNPGRIIVGDRSARQFPDTAGVFERSGLRQAALDAGADEVYAAKSPVDAPDEWMLLQPERWEETWMAAGGLLAMKRILEADHLINVPTCKNHRYALYSMSMKNFVGAIGDASRDPLHFGSFPNISRDIAIMNQMFKPTLNIIDATTALVNGGPQGDGSDAVRTSPGLIIASSDRIAADAAGVSLIQRELMTASVPRPDAANSSLVRDPAWQLPQIQHGIERKLGVASAAAVMLAFDAVNDSAGIEAKFRA